MNGKCFSAFAIKILGSECNIGTKYEKKWIYEYYKYVLC